MRVSHSESLDVIVVGDHDEPAQPEPASLHLAVVRRRTVQTLGLTVAGRRLLPGPLPASWALTGLQGTQVKQTQPSDSKPRGPLCLSLSFIGSSCLNVPFCLIGCYMKCFLDD